MLSKRWTTGGTLTIEAGETPNGAPMFSVSDTGRGMSRTLHRNAAVSSVLHYQENRHRSRALHLPRSDQGQRRHDRSRFSRRRWNDISRRATIDSTTTGVTKKWRGKCPSAIHARYARSSKQYSPRSFVLGARVRRLSLFCRYQFVREMSNQPQPKGTVLVVDDDDAVRSGLYWALTSDYQVLQAASRDEACCANQRRRDRRGGK